MRLRSAPGCIAVLVASLADMAAHAQSTRFMEPIAATMASSPAATTAQNVLALNSAMFELYGSASRVFQRNIQANHPIILGMFSTEGGRFILNRPGLPPLDAPTAPVGHIADRSVGALFSTITS